MTYVDGFLLPVPKSKVAAYRKMARQGGKLWMKHGALEFKECIADDLNVQMPDGKKAPSLFPKMVKAKRGETVVFSYIVFKSRAHRDAVNKKVFTDPSMGNMDMSDMPFDVKRMAYGGFKVLVDGESRRRGDSGRSDNRQVIALSPPSPLAPSPALFSTRNGGAPPPSPRRKRLTPQGVD